MFDNSTNDIERICTKNNDDAKRMISSTDQVLGALKELNDAKKAMLESSVYALQEGEA